MLQDPKPLMNPKETSLMTHPDTSTKMEDINLSAKIKLLVLHNDTWNYLTVWKKWIIGITLQNLELFNCVQTSELWLV